MTLSPGLTIGRYQILSLIGHGGMAIVYKAYQPSLDRTVALKVVRQGFADDQDFMQRFEREAKAIARLDHPHIVHVHDFDNVDGHAFLVMQYVEGGTLKERTSELLQHGQRLPQPEIARIVTEVAEALSYAHGQGIVHRDIKPSNVMLTRDGRAVVSDFGIAKILSAQQQTQTGVGLGTPEYMSPEQGQGQAVDGRSDIYSLGILAYELLVGRLPYSAETPFAVVLAHVRDPLPLPSAINPEVGPQTERALLRAVAKIPSERFAEATQFSTALAQAIAADARTTAATRVPVAAVPGAPARTSVTIALPRARPATAAIAAVGLLVAAGAGAFAFGAFGRSATSPAPVAAATAAAPTAQATAVATASPVSTSAPPSPTAGGGTAPFNASQVARGELLLDVMPSTLRRTTPLGSDGVTFTAGTDGLDITINKVPRTASLSVPLRVSNYVVDLELALPPLTANWTIGMELQKGDGAKDLQMSIASTATGQVYFSGPGGGGVRVGPEFAITPGGPFRMTIAVTDHRVRIVRNGTVLVDVVQSLLDPVGFGPFLYLQGDDALNVVAMRIVAIRYYAAP